MKTERKRSFRRFEYRECDAFARYLEKQAEKGLHFQKWHMGLVFESGEPRKTVYSVEVFPKGREEDSRPEKDAEEFAEYCKAAGWELVDGQRKFCVFRRTGRDAVPIATPGERFENIRRAERNRLYTPLITVLALLVMVNVLSGNLAYLLFDTRTLVWTGIVLALVLFSCLDFFAALYWIWKQKRILANGETPYYGKTWWKFPSELFYGSLIAAMILQQIIEPGAFTSLNWGTHLIRYLPYIVWGLTALLAAVFRPSVERKMQIQWGLLGGLLLLGLALAIFAEDTGEPQLAEERDVPLTLADYKEVSGEVSIIGKRSDSLFGEHYEYLADYSQAAGGLERIQYEVFDCRYNWMKTYLWSTRDSWKFAGFGKLNVDAESLMDCKADWGAEEAWQYQLESDTFYMGKYHYEICYPKQVAVIRTMEELDAEDIRIIREKLSLQSAPEEGEQ